MTKTALITGASSGIGLALARQFAGEGWNLVLVARRQAQLEHLAKQLKDEFGVNSHCIAIDLSKENSARVLHDEVRFRNLEIDCLVNNAGRGHYGAFIDQPREISEETLYLNITTLTSLCHLFGKEFSNRGNGYILNIASVAAFIPGPGMAIYNATKSYVLSLSRALHAELADDGVTVTASCPGPTESEFFDKAGTDNLKAMEYIKLMPASQVAKEAYRALMKGQSVVVHGVLNKMMTETTRWLPRSWVAPMVKSLMR
ncbi:short-chain dehydrogenase [Hahella sp. CCB-MM4]|uniref:SDR family NAD(P)-dependent oxidoreductase n=1 Tax=Hahella sp. (strain CCB-MM4) TaxID=1926491 RepID=UPI000B9AC902|nr:SDR family oxidoreductase [Hahella sp. CCB-MM4]OZG72217.1 short-chain dehydrogenase [Hahella sp. CCB-MM4]